jgi:outer membrane lipoprotein-sorting protein
MFITTLASAIFATSAPAYTWRDIVQPGFRDITFVGKAVTASKRELKKISTDFEVSYRLLGSEVHAEIKEPFMLRMESRVEDTEVQYIQNATKRTFRVPRSNISKVENIADAPGKRQTVLDFGILVPSLFETLFDGNYVRTDRETGDLVFDLTYKKPLYDDSSRQRIWVDTQRHFVKKREWFAQDGHQMATFIYEDARLQNGIWFPSRAIVKNVDNAVAGVTEYSKVSVNSGLADRDFKF